MTATGFDAWPLTVAHFIVMGVFAIFVIAGILWGIRRKRERLAAEQELIEHREAADVPVAPPVNAPATQVRPVAPPPADTAAVPPAGDITQLKGLGPKLAATLADLGVTRIDQIAAMSPAELDALDARLGAFRGRPARDRWAEQARLLAGGDRVAYEAEFGKLGG